MVNCINLIIEMSPRFVLGRENVPCVAEVVNRLLKADCTDFTVIYWIFQPATSSKYCLIGERLDVDSQRTKKCTFHLDFRGERVENKEK